MAIPGPAISVTKKHDFVKVRHALFCWLGWRGADSSDLGIMKGCGQGEGGFAPGYGLSQRSYFVMTECLKTKHCDIA
jgi:hypothetical protein